MTAYLILLLFHLLTFVPLNIVGRMANRDLRLPLRFGRRTGPLRLLFLRGDTVPLRMNLDLHLVILLSLALDFSVPAQALLFATTFVLGLVYMTYYYVIEVCYGEDASLLDDLRFAKSGWDILMGSYRLLLFGSLFGLGFLMVGAYFLSVICVQHVTMNSTFLGITMAGMLLWMVSNMHREVGKHLRSHNVASPVMHLIRNAWRSAALWRKFAREMIQRTASFSYSLDFRLKEKPNIHFIFIESYGLDFIANPESPARELYPSLLEQLEAQDWICRSHLSKANISGGKSWLSYSSVLKGMQINSIGEYNYLYKDEAHLSYPPFLKTLGDDGYATFLLNGLGGFGDYAIDWERMQRFLGFDQQILADQLEFKGSYDGYPKQSPPDQYTLNKGLSLIRERSANRPYAYFNLTLNSHVPWHSPERPEPQWQDLNDQEIRTDKQSTATTRYNNAIRYQLETLCQLVLKQGDERDLFILIGDHQPFHKTSRIDDNFTVVHILSKSSEFSEALEAYGFTQGMQPSESGTPINHEGLMSILMRTMGQAFGEDDCEIPQYTPNGFDFGEPM